MTVPELLDRYLSGALTVEAAARARAERIEREDRGEGGLRSLLRPNPRLAEDARALDALLGSLPAPRRPEDLPALLGVPVAVKDNIDTVDLGCTAGSVLLEGVPVESDAPVVTRLRSAGALIVGKANLSEWANYRSTRSTSGWSSAGGQTLNPVDRTRTPCGSSSGSASAVRAGLALCAVGTETDGSILCPAATQGLVGFRPAVGTVPGEGIVPISPSQDTAGPIALTVEDAFRLQEVLEGRTDAASGVRPRPERIPAGELRLGVFDPGKDIHPRVAALWLRARERLAGAGFRLVDLPPLADPDRIEAAEETILDYEFPRALARYLAERRPRSPFRTLEDLRRANLERADAVLGPFGQEIWDRILSPAAPSEEAYLRAKAEVDDRARRRGIDPWFEDPGIDAAICPANGPAWVIDPVNGDRYTGTPTPPGAAAGYPGITVPMGTVSGLPIGLYLLARPGGEARLWSAAAAAERALAAAT